MNAILKTMHTLSVTLIFAGPLAGEANAASITFVPPNDVTGQIYSTGSNDGWSSGRGIVFSTDTDMAISSVALLQNVTDQLISFEISRVAGLSGDLNPGLNVLASGSNSFTTSGLEFIQFTFPALTFLAESNYHIEFTFSGSSNQNFFYNNANIPFNQGHFISIDGTMSANTANSVMPSIRVNASPVPEPSVFMLLMGAGSLIMVFGRRRHSKPQ